MRRCILLLCLASLIGTVAGCDTSPISRRSTPWTRIVADGRFVCGHRPVDGDPAPDRPDGVRVALDRTVFACRFAGSVDCVLWVSAINGKQEYWITARSSERVRLVEALGDVLGWDPVLVDGLAHTGDLGGAWDRAEWYVGFGGALVVNIDDPSPVT